MCRPNQFSRRSAILAMISLPLGPQVLLAQARPLDAPRAAGQVGEQNDGFAVARGSVPKDVTELVSKINAERRALYAEQASKQKVPIEAIGKIYAAEIVKAAPPKTWYQNESGQWVQK